MKYWGIYKGKELVSSFNRDRPFIYNGKSVAERNVVFACGETVHEVKITKVEKKGKK